MNEQLLLENVRSVLIRLEETIIFALIERAQFHANDTIYQPHVWGDATGGQSLVSYLLHETERVHASVRRYTSPDEHPFFSDLDEPILPRLSYRENPLKPNTVSLNPAVRVAYETGIVPYICQPGDDGQYGSSAVCDGQCLQALSKRVHYGKFVAESKFLSETEVFRELIAQGARDAILERITDEAIEVKVLDRVFLKARTYGQDIGGDSTQHKIEPGRVVDVYRRWIIPLTKRVEVEYLLQR